MKTAKSVTVSFSGSMPMWAFNGVGQKVQLIEDFEDGVVYRAGAIGVLDGMTQSSSPDGVLALVAFSADLGDLSNVPFSLLQPVGYPSVDKNRRRLLELFSEDELLQIEVALEGQIRDFKRAVADHLSPEKFRIRNAHKLEILQSGFQKIAGCRV